MLVNAVAVLFKSLGYVLKASSILACLVVVIVPFSTSSDTMLLKFVTDFGLKIPDLIRSLTYATISFGFWIKVFI